MGSFSNRTIKAEDRAFHGDAYIAGGGDFEARSESNTVDPGEDSWVVGLEGRP
jgi:hypothetical protein